MWFGVSSTYCDNANADDVLNHSSDSIGYYVAKPLSSESVES